jgi:hypothetical protein
MILIEMYPCVNHFESLQRERYWCENLNATLNSVVPSRTIQEYKKIYNEQHKDHKVDQNNIIIKLKKSN